MTTETPQQLEAQLAAHLAGLVSCRVISATDGRIGCVTPLQHLDGDSVVVWIRPLAGQRYEVTDYGEALAESIAGRGQERRALEEFAASAAAGQGVRYFGGRLTTDCSSDDLAECVWRVALAIAQLSNASASLRPRRDREAEFVTTVELDLRAHQVPVERERALAGLSGHRYRATFFVPESETVIEPVAGHWNQVTAVYAKLGDLRQANGYRLLSLVDDRKHRATEEVSNILSQVSDVVAWSRREEWIDSVAHRHN